MGIFDLFRRGSERRDAMRETRSLENPSVPISSRNVIAFLGLEADSAPGELVTVDSALGVPAVWDAVNFLSGTLAGLPVQVFERTGEGRERIEGGLATILHDAVNDGMSSFEWRKSLFDNVFTHGRGVSFIERNTAGRVVNLWPLDPAGLTIRMSRGRKFYDYSEGEDSRRPRVTYEASEVVDIPFMLRSDQLTHRSPLLANRDVIGLAQAVTKHGGRFFANGGVPPFAVTGPFQSPSATERASEDLQGAIRKAAKENRQALVMPPDHNIVPIGSDQEKSQFIETQRFLIEQIARIYSLPPTFLQDLTHGTFSNTEQQDLHFVKHTLKRWVEQFEQELNLKLFGRHNTQQYVELNVDGLLRGDFKTRIEGYATGIQNAIFTPNEVRRRENLPDDNDHGDDLLVQGATVPLGQQPETESAPMGDNDE